MGEVKKNLFFPWKENMGKVKVIFVFLIFVSHKQHIKSSGLYEVDISSNAEYSFFLIEEDYISRLNIKHIIHTKFVEI